ncbi:MAG: hypothetical protein AVDCRST_MAG95-2146, partial [uncultured Adhaeribacter sp.]
YAQRRREKQKSGRPGKSIRHCRTHRFRRRNQCL